MHSLVRIVAAIAISVPHPMQAKGAEPAKPEDPPSSSAYSVQLIGADLVSDQTFKIIVGPSFDDSKPKPNPQPVKVAKTAYVAPHRAVKTQAYDLSSLQQYARGIIDSTWDDSYWEAFDWIITEESGWRFDAEEPTTHAYGLCQAMPASKMANAGLDYLTNPTIQVAWCISYVKNRYGTPQNAKDFHLLHGWF